MTSLQEPEKQKEVFLSATYKDQKDCIEEVKSKLAELGVKAHHFKEGLFFDGRINIHSHDRCLELVKKIPNYMLIVSFEAGSFYEGKKKAYKGLTVTHSEFRTAHEAFTRNRRVYPFVRKEVWDLYNAMKHIAESERMKLSIDFDVNLFPLLDDITSHGKFVDTFNTSIDLKKMISEKVDYFV